jgi:hypothetical protein
MHSIAAVRRVQRAWRARASRKLCSLRRSVLDSVECTVCYTPCIPLLCNNDHVMCRGCWFKTEPTPPTMTRACAICRSTGGHRRAVDMACAVGRIVGDVPCGDCDERTPLTEMDTHRAHRCPKRVCTCPFHCRLGQRILAADLYAHVTTQHVGVLQVGGVGGRSDRCALVQIVGAHGRAVVAWPDRLMYVGIAVTALCAGGYSVALTGHGVRDVDVSVINPCTGEATLTLDYERTYDAVCCGLAQSPTWWNAFTFGVSAVVGGRRSYVAVKAVHDTSIAATRRVAEARPVGVVDSNSVQTTFVCSLMILSKW